MGISASTMMAYAAVAGAAASTYTALTAKKPETPRMTEDKIQAAKTPEPRQKPTANPALAGPLAGNASTLLTGPSGIDSSMLSIGRNKMFGE